MPAIKYAKPDRIAIGKRIYDGELNCHAAAKEYGIGYITARRYQRMYKEQLPAVGEGK